MGHIYPVWYDEKFTPEDFYKACEWITNRYKNDDTIIAFDLKNEPHGKPWQDTTFAKWDNSTDINNWKYAAETCAKRILNINPNLLIVIEGIEAYQRTTSHGHQNPPATTIQHGGAVTCEVLESILLIWVNIKIKLYIRHMITGHLFTSSRGFIQGSQKSLYYKIVGVRIGRTLWKKTLRHF